MFIKPGHIPESVREMLKLDVINECLQKSDKELHGGHYAFVSMNKARLEKRTRSGFIHCILISEQAILLQLKSY